MGNFSFEEEIQAEAARIRDNAYCVKEHFDLVFNHFIKKPQKYKTIEIVDELVDEDSLPRILQDAHHKEFVLMFYAHKPHAPHINPFFPKQTRAHISLLLCKTDKNNITHVLNIDGYHFPGYVDILGERPGASRNPYIDQQLVVRALSLASRNKTPLQRASWRNMNCVLYAFTFAERILHLFETDPGLFSSIFSSEKSLAYLLPNLEQAILAGMVDKYVTEQHGELIYNEEVRDAYHDRVRGVLAEKFIAESRQEFAVSTVKSQCSVEKNIAPNYTFLLNAGILLSSTLCLSFFTIAAIALLGVIALPSLVIGGTLAAGLVSSLATYGMFQARTKENPDEANPQFFPEPI
ncbi:hypothetical protein Lade_0857 [Legionella adelaidensis]|uniref:Uncharacterized protein n=1 Tax=Legionella adelaidensis TaxID=45056 RepID=A0A0W0R592_9GAMM|nr:hypothetical protein [Legionella adelaidensis]KTC66199.1 hypothetical protein Lade_0857 [Legionella adelaidensis]